ncbi:MAG: tripartite tricarboxylate transporter permease [Betaproteobacteria bacterium]|nr:tripartite tricarboxylate transporter permease [Betaproteobacteria bacterium]
MFDLLGTALVNVAQVKYLLPLFFGTLAGVVGGALPGVTITMTIIVVLPFTFGLDPLQGLAAMTGVYVGGSAGGLITACLIGIPGTPSAIATTFDGHPMAKKGEPGRAVWLGVWASFFGGLLGGAFLILATGPLAKFALQFGPWEFFSLFVFALSMVAGLVESSLAKGLVSGGLGLIVTILGSDPVMGQKRLTLGIPFLEGGIDFLPVLIGVFAFAQIMSEVERMGGAEKLADAVDRSLGLAVSHLKVIGEILGRPFLLLWVAFIGVVIGVLPAIGGSAASMMAYDQAKKLSKHPQKFGSGVPEGIIASEASNNANVGGSLVTIMAFGIPGDAVTAVMLGALTIHGIQSGPLFILQNPELAYGIFAAYLLAHPLMVLIIGLSTSFMLRIVTVPKAVLFPVVLVLCVIGAYALNNTMSNVYVLLAFGLIGYAMVKGGFPLAPFILGVILGDQIEINLIRAIMTDADPWLFLTRPISGALIALSVASVVFAIWQHYRHQSKVAGDSETDF